MRIRQVLVSATVGVLVAAGASATRAAATPTPDSVHALVAAMSLEQKVGQLFATYVYGDSSTTTDPAYTSQNQAAYGVANGAEVVAKYQLGSVIYFTFGLQQAAGDVPLLTSTDQEGGNVTRIGAPLAVSPGNMAIGATFSVPDSYSMSNATGVQLKTLGINVDDAPVVDTNTNPANSADGPRLSARRSRTPRQPRQRLTRSRSCATRPARFRSSAAAATTCSSPDGVPERPRRSLARSPLAA